MAAKKADLIGDELVEQGWEVALEVVGGVADRARLLVNGEVVGGEPAAPPRQAAPA